MQLEFDRGTIVLRCSTDADNGVDPAQLPGVLWDPRVGVFRAPARFADELRVELVRRGVRFSDAVRTPPDVSAGLSGFPRPSLRPYQEAALLAWEAAGRRGIVALPTGSGKTRVALGAIAAVGARALCLVPTRVLLEQWRREIARSYPGAIGSVGDGHHEIEPITVATFESAWRQMDRLGNQFDLLVVDEAHHFGSGVRDECLEMSAASARLGLTATPPREEAALRRLEDLVGPVVFELAIGDLAGTFLANFDLLTLRLDLAPSERRDYDRWMASFLEVRRAHARMSPGADWREFVQSAGMTDAGRRALAAFRRARTLLAFTAAKRAALAALLEKHRESRVIVFTACNETAYDIAREHLVMPITADIGRKERDETLASFRTGALRVLVSTRVLNEGLDVPDADVGIVVGAAQGEREHTQRIGRLLRPRPGKRALVYEMVTRRTMEVRQSERRNRGIDS